MRDNQNKINILNMISDGILIYLSYFIAIYIRFIVLEGRIIITLWEPPFTYFALTFSCGVVLTFYHMKMYGSFRFTSQLSEIFNIFFINGIGVVFYSSLLFMLKFTDFSRRVLLLFWLISGTMVSIKRIVIRAILRKKKIQGYGKKNVLIVGDGSLAVNYAKKITADRGKKLIGYIGARKESIYADYLGRYEDLENILNTHEIDELVVALGAHETEFTRPIVQCAERRGLSLRLIPFYSEYFSEKVNFSAEKGTGVIKYDRRLSHKHPVVSERKIYWIGKRIFDFIAALAAIIVLAIPMAVVALLIYLDDPNGSPIFSQQRIGRKGKFFKMYKFRSMVVNAEDLLKELQDKNEADGLAFKIKEDPRITKIGKFIRKTSIDELPQLFNVLKGDMSIVGPRPALAEEAERYSEIQKQRLSVTPGLTCYWQVTPNRNDLTFDEWMELDIRYIYERSWWVDLKLIFRTVGVMLGKEGR